MVTTIVENCVYNESRRCSITYSHFLKSLKFKLSSLTNSCKRDENEVERIEVGPFRSEFEKAEYLRCQ